MNHVCSGNVYLADCLACCVRLVKSARPDRKQQEAMLNYLVRCGKYSRDEIIIALKTAASE